MLIWLCHWTHAHTHAHTHMHTHTHVHRVLKLPLRTSTWFTQVPWRYFQALIISWLCFFTFPWFSDIILTIAASSSLNFVRAMSSMVSTCILAPRRTICGSRNWSSAIFKTLSYLNGVQRLPFFDYVFYLLPGTWWYRNVQYYTTSFKWVSFMLCVVRIKRFETCFKNSFFADRKFRHPSFSSTRGVLVLLNFPAFSPELAESLGATEIEVWICNFNVKAWKTTEHKLHKI